MLQKPRTLTIMIIRIELSIFETDSVKNMKKLKRGNTVDLQCLFKKVKNLKFEYDYVPNNIIDKVDAW